MRYEEVIQKVKRTILIVNEKEELPSVLSSLVGKSIFYEKFSVEKSDKQFYCHILAFDTTDIGRYSDKLYKCLDIVNNLDRCAIIESNLEKNTFAVFGVLPYDFRTKYVMYAFDDDNPDGERDLFLSSFSFFDTSLKDKSKFIIPFIDVQSWLFKVSAIPTPITEDILNQIYVRKLYCLF